MNDYEVQAAAHRFALLSDPTRLRILHTLIERGEMSVGDIAAASGASRFNTSAHLGRLALGGLVARRRERSSVYYRIDDSNLPRICDLMCESLRRHGRSTVRMVAG